MEGSTVQVIYPRVFGVIPRRDVEGHEKIICFVNIAAGANRDVLVNVTNTMMVNYFNTGALVES